MEGEFERLLQGVPRSSVFYRLFFQQKLLGFQLVDALFVRLNNAGIAGFHNPIEQGFDLLFDILGISLARFGIALGFGKARVPDVAEHGLGHFDQIFRRLKPPKNALEIAFELVAPDRLAIAGAALRLTQIVGVLLARLAGGPARGQRFAAIVALYEAAQHEVFVDVLTRRSLGGSL